MSGNKMEKLTEKEMEVVTAVFRSFETGLREATILPQVGYLVVSDLNSTRVSYLRQTKKQK